MDETLSGFDRFMVWLEAQPQDTTYEWTDVDDCLFARWARDAGINLETATGILDWDHAASTQLFIEIGMSEPHAYAAALERAKWWQDHPDDLARERDARVPTAVPVAQRTDVTVHIDQVVTANVVPRLPLRLTYGHGEGPLAQARPT